MAEEENPRSLLTLVIEKGPRSGETLKFKPTDPLIRLGRVVRGNSVPIKDPGISTKHLTIEFKSPNWVITDLGSSNGTVLNSDQLPSLSPTVLRDADLVKIGEITIIRVGIKGNEMEKQPRGRARREKAAEKEDIESGFCEELGKRVTRGGMRREKAAEEDTESGFGGELGKRVLRGRTRREKAAEERENVIEEDAELGFGGDLGKKGVGVGKRGRGRPKREKGGIFSENVGRVEIEKSSVDEEVGVAAEVFEKKTRGKRGKEKVPDAMDMGLVKVEPGPVSTRGTRSVRMVENAEKEDVDGVKMTGKDKKRNDIKGKLSSGKGNCSERGNVINVQSGDGLNSERVVVKSEPRESFCEVENVGSLHSLGENEEEREEGGESVKESGSKSLEAPDLAKMTLRDYFDYLEESIPKQIIEETELIIAEMHKKAELYREFVHEHKKG